MSEELDFQARREARRVPVSDTVKVEFEKFSGFITEYASNISLGGMFIKNDEPRSIGSELSFEIVLSDGFRLVQGTGEVAWTRSETQGPDKPSGMGIRFHDLDDSSRELIDKMVYHRLMDGGKPFELERTSEEQKTPVEPEVELSSSPPSPLPVDSAEEPAAVPLEPSLDSEPEAASASPEPQMMPVEPVTAPDQLPELGDVPSLGMGADPAFDLGGDSSFSGLRNVLNSEPSTLVEPPPDLAVTVIPGAVSEAPVDQSIDALSSELPGTVEEPPALGDISLPEPDLPPIDHPESIDGAEIEPPASFSEPPQSPELAPVSLSGGFGEDPGPPPSPPSFPEPAGQELDDSLLSMDGGMLRGTAAEPPDPGPGPSLDDPGLDPVVEPAATILEPWDEAEDEDDEEEEWESPPQRGVGRILLPVISILLIAAAGYFLRDFWLPMITGEGASTEAPSVAIAEPAEDPMDGAPATGDESTMAADESIEVSDPTLAQELADPRLKVIPPPAVVPQKPEPEPEVPSGAALTGIDRMTWKAEPNGLQITFWADGRVSGALLSHHHIGGENPRELLKIRGVSRPFAGDGEEVGDGRVKKIRFGYHQGDSGNEIHVVFDLSSDSVTVRELDTSGSKISLVLN